MKFRKITVGLCALMCFASLTGCKTRSEVPPLDEGSSVTYSSSAAESSGTKSSASGGVGTSSASESASKNNETAHVHNYEVKETVEPTCVEDGWSEFVCECGDSYSVDLAATGHSYSKTTIEADCVNPGCTRYTCNVCGYSYDNNFVSTVDHKYGAWKTVTEATFYYEGEKQATCSRCGKTISEAIPQLESSVSYDDFTSEVVRLVNIERANYGLSPLKENSTLEDYAQLRSEEIVDTFAHTRPDGTRALEYLRGLGTFRTYGENIAMGQSTPEQVVNDWMNSEGHRANILKEDYTMIGVGCSFAGGAYYWVQIFGG